MEVLNRAKQENGVGYYLNKGLTIKVHLEISGIWNNINTKHAFLNNPCYNRENHSFWKDVQLPIYLRELVILKITNQEVLKRVTDSYLYKKGTVIGRHYNLDRIPYRDLSNSDLVKIRLK